MSPDTFSTVQLSKESEGALLETPSSLIYGGKAISLFDLTKNGLPVPEFCCLPTTELEGLLQANHFETLQSWMRSPGLLSSQHREEISVLRDISLPNSALDTIQNFTDRFSNERFAVRSSGTLEDGAESSFAGLFETQLNVTVGELENAIKECWMALFSTRVSEYLIRKKIDSSIGIAVVIQRMVQSEKSGVLFSVDPIRGVDTEMSVEACFGLGEALVSGQVTPDRYRYDWYSKIETQREISDKEWKCISIQNKPFTKIVPVELERQKQEVLSKAELKTLIALGLKIQSQTGMPVDVEWAIEKGTLYILQSRPITKLSFSGVSGEWTTADFRDGGVSSSVCTPLMASLYKSIFDKTMQDALERLGLWPKGQSSTWQKSFYGRPYWNLSSVKECLSKIINYNERIFDQGLGINASYKGDGYVTKTNLKTIWKSLKALWVIRNNCRRQLRMSPHFVAQQKKRLKELRSLNLASYSNIEFFQIYEELILKDYDRSESTYFNFIYDNSNLNSLFRDKVKKLSFDQAKYPILLSGLTSVSHLKQMETMWSIREEIQKDASSSSYWNSQSPEKIVLDYKKGLRQNKLILLESFLVEFGHHARHELDLMIPRYIESPIDVIKEIKALLCQNDSNSPEKRNKNQLQKAKEVARELMESVPFYKRRFLASNLKQVRAFLWWREELRDLSTQFYMHIRFATLELEKRLIKMGYLKNENEIFFLERKELLQICRGELSELMAQKIVKQNGDYYNSFRHFTNPDEIGDRFEGVKESAKSGELQGIPGSPGMIRATARVVDSIDDADRLKPGDILITRCTDPAWTPKFSDLQGVVTETGGLLSHAAVICREYGIPAVLAVKNATKVIKDGQEIEIDGNRGLIVSLDAKLDAIK